MEKLQTRKIVQVKKSEIRSKKKKKSKDKAWPGAARDRDFCIRKEKFDGREVVVSYRKESGKVDFSTREIISDLEGEPSLQDIRLERCRCFLCGKEFFNEDGLANHVGECEGNQGARILDGFKLKEQAKGVISDIIDVAQPQRFCDGVSISVGGPIK